MGQTLLPGSKWVVLKTILGFVRAGLRKQGLMVPLTGGSGSGGAGGSAGVAARDIGFPGEIFSRFEVGDSRMTRHPLGGGGGGAGAVAGKEEAGGKEVRLGGGDSWEDVEGWVFGIGQGVDVGKEGSGGRVARKARDDEGDEYELGEILSVSRGDPSCSRLVLTLNTLCSYMVHPVETLPQPPTPPPLLSPRIRSTRF
jgi:hypothetical protein